MPTRSRTFVGGTPKGRLRTSTGVIFGGDHHIETSAGTCTDYVGPGDGWPLTIEKWESSGGIIDGQGAGQRYAWDYLSDAINTPANWPHIQPAGIPLNSELATTAAARTNPSRPIVDIPVSLFELREMVYLIKKMGDDILAKAGGQYLSTSFFVLPIVSDLRKLLDVQADIDRRVKVIKRLKERGYKRTIKVWAGMATSEKVVTYNSSGILISAKCRGQTAMFIRCFCKWAPTHDLASVDTPDEIRRLAAKAVTGNHLSFSTMWESVPWTWLMDWAGNMSQFLMAHRNTVPAQLLGVSVMKHVRTLWTSEPGFSSQSTGRIAMSPHRFLRESKNRVSASVLPLAHFPFLNGKQVSTLAALVAARR